MGWGPRGVDLGRWITGPESRSAGHGVGGRTTGSDRREREPRTSESYPGFGNRTSGGSEPE